jgi:hypothetical protein
MRALLTTAFALSLASGLACAAGGAGSPDDSGVPATTGQAGFNGRYMNDVWAAVAMGVPSPTWGNTAFSKGPLPGLFA